MIYNSFARSSLGYRELIHLPLSPPPDLRSSTSPSSLPPAMLRPPRCADDVVLLEFPPSSSLSIDVDESSETRIRRLITEHPVIIFSRTSCCMCHVMKHLLAAIGVNPAVIELDDDEISAVPSSVPAVFIGGISFGGLETLVALHLGGHLVPKLVEVGALPVSPSCS